MGGTAISHVKATGVPTRLALLSPKPPVSKGENEPVAGDKLRREKGREDEPLPRTPGRALCVSAFHQSARKNAQLGEFGTPSWGMCGLVYFDRYNLMLLIEGGTSQRTDDRSRVSSVQVTDREGPRPPCAPAAAGRSGGGGSASARLGWGVAADTRDNTQAVCPPAERGHTDAGIRVR